MIKHIFISLIFALPVKASYLPGAVMSTTGSSVNGSSVVKVEFARIANAGSCSITSQTGFIQSVSRAGAGNCVMTLYTGIFSGTPICVCSAHNNLNNGCNANNNPSSATTVDAVTFAVDTSTATDHPFDLLCGGVK